MKIKMQYKKSTKNTHVFEEINEDDTLMKDVEASIPSLYIRKRAFNNVPTTIHVEVTYD